MKTNVICDGKMYVMSDDKAIHASNDPTNCHIETLFDKRYPDGGIISEARIAGCTPNENGRTWVEFSLTEWKAKRRSFSGFCIDGRENVERLRDLCNLVLGEAS